MSDGSGEVEGLSLFEVGRAHLKEGRLAAAIAAFENALRSRPESSEAMHFLGVALFKAGRIDDAANILDRALELKPEFPPALMALANVHQAQNRLESALALYDRVLLLDRDMAAAHYNRGLALAALARHDQAIGSYRKAIALKHGFAEAYVNLGALLQAQGDVDGAVLAYREATAINPNLVEAQRNLAQLLVSLEGFEEAIACYEKACALQPGSAEIRNALGCALGMASRHSDAVTQFDAALASAPDFADAHSNRGVALAELDRFPEALQAFKAAAALKSPDAEMFVRIGNLYRDFGHCRDAVDNYAKALATDPSHAVALSLYAYWCAKQCDWDTGLDYRQLLIRRCADADYNGEVFPLLSIVDDPVLHLKAAENYARNKFGDRRVAPEPAKPRRQGAKIRVAYVAATFHENAMTYLITALIEQHDRSRFEVFGISYGKSNESPARRRIAGAFDRFIEARGMSDRRIAQIIRDNEIDIAVDLTGYTGEGRIGILADRPARCQVSYLGYPGTLGAAFIDYIVGDAVVIPEGADNTFAERVVRLPVCYQANTRDLGTDAALVGRADVGLPERGFVFSSFNNPFKITPDIFDVWMRLLRNVPGSILWIFVDNDGAETNLRKECMKRGVDAARLVFARPLPLTAHLARQRLADLFLDTYPCNAHTTASDAVRVGLPLLTCAGRGFASRVAASVLGYAGVPELATSNLEEYEARALRLATHPDELERIAAKLAQGAAGNPLFDVDPLRGHLEVAYETILAGK